MEAILIWLINTTVQIITLLVIVKVILSYFMSPYHPVREFIDRLVEPLLSPLRRVIPPMGMFDFTPIILIVILQILRTILINLILAIF